jgi:hypothetical protein
VLVFLMGVICEVDYSVGLRYRDICTKFHEDWFSHSRNIKVNTSTVRDAIVLVVLMERNYDVRH